MHGSRKFCQRGSITLTFFVCLLFSEVDEGRTEDPYYHLTLKSGPSSAHQRNPI